MRKTVSKHTKKKLLATSKRIRKNMPLLAKMRKSNHKQPDSAVMFSMAKYYGTLTHLAKE